MNHSITNLEQPTSAVATALSTPRLTLDQAQRFTSLLIAFGLDPDHVIRGIGASSMDDLPDAVIQRVLLLLDHRVTDVPTKDTPSA